MNRKAIAVLAAALLLVAVWASGQDKRAEPSDVNGFTYMGFIPMNEDMIPDPTANTILPVYLVLGQDGAKVFGCLVLPDYEEIGESPPGDINMTLIEWTVSDGARNGDVITMDFEEENKNKVKWDFEARVRENGEKLDLYIKVFIFAVGPFELVRCNKANYLSGLYVGSWGYTAPPAALNNILLGARVDGTAMRFSAFLYDPIDPTERYTFEGTAAYTPATGRFNYSGDTDYGHIAISGAVAADGAMTANVTLDDGNPASGRLSFFQKTGAAFKVKKPKPAAVPAGGQEWVKLKHKGGLRGTFISEDNPKVTIEKYRYTDKVFEVLLNVPADATGTVNFTAKSPDGKTVRAKKSVVIQ